MKEILKILSIVAILFSIFANSHAGEDNKIKLSTENENNSNVKDCFESVNRGVFAFNQGLDSALFEPIAKGYRKLPFPIRTGAGNVVNNISNLVTVPNNLLQGNIKAAGINVLRFTLNTTIGVLGIWDAASAMGFQKLDKEDYGQTLASWGVGPGCYIILPILGPSTARDTVGSMANFVGGDAWYNVTVRNDTQYFNDANYYSSRGTQGIDFRAKNIESFNNLEENSLDFYASVKSLYLQDRERKISNLDKVTETMDDSDWEEIESN